MKKLHSLTRPVSNPLGRRSEKINSEQGGKDKAAELKSIRDTFDAEAEEFYDMADDLSRHEEQIKEFQPLARNIRSILNRMDTCIERVRELRLRASILDAEGERKWLSEMAEFELNAVYLQKEWSNWKH